jgi:hypothetical protein
MIRLNKIQKKDYALEFIRISDIQIRISHVRLLYDGQELGRNRILVVLGIVEVHQFRMLLVNVIVQEE